MHKAISFSLNCLANNEKCTKQYFVTISKKKK